MNISVKCIFRLISSEILDYQDYMETKTTFEFFFLIQKILYFIRIPIKCINCRIKGFQKKCDLQTYLLTDKVIHRGSPLLKKLIKFTDSVNLITKIPYPASLLSMLA